MFLSRVQIGSYRVGSIRVDYFRLRIYSDSVFSGKKILDPKNTCKFLVQFQFMYFWVGFDLGFQVLVKMSKPSKSNAMHT